MDRKIKVVYKKDLIKEFAVDTRFEDIAKSFQNEFSFPILAARVNNEIENLDKVLEKKCDIDFYDRSSLIGNEIYASGIQFLMTAAFYKVFNDVNVVIQNSVNNGVFCETDKEISADDLKLVNDKMLEMIKDDYKFVSLSVSRRDAINFFKSKNRKDKVHLLKYVSNSLITLYRIDDYYDYFFTELPVSTRYVDEFKLKYIGKNEFVLTYPTSAHPGSALEFKKHDKLVDSFAEYAAMCKNIGITNVSDLNEIVSVGQYNYVIQLAEAYYNSQLASIADTIDKKKNVKIILLAGPSSSGKTTTSKKLAIYLQARGYRTHSVSTDDYFFNLVDTPKKENGEYDIESIKAVDTDLFNKHLLKLLAGEKVLLPEYNFVLGQREYKNRNLQLADKDIIVIEGLHALNNELTMALDDKAKFKIYISPLTQLNIDDHNRIHTTDTRKLRRIIRDNKYRNYNSSQTLSNWKNITEGELEYVYPYQNEADVVFNSALLYEIGVLKTFAEPLLFSVNEDDEMYPEAIRLINLLRNFLPIPSDDVPKESVLREFIGGSIFREEEK